MAPVPDPSDRSRHEQDERSFFTDYYGSAAYNPTGWRLRMKRDLRVLLRAAGRPLGRVLSVGCGDGAFELLLAPHASHVVGLDLSPEAIERAERARAGQGVRNVEFRCLSFRDLAWNERFDTIVCLAFLHHVPEAELPGFLRACHEHVVPGGLFFSQDPNVRGVLRAIGRRVLGARYHAYHSPDERELDPAELARAVSAAGFTSVAIRHVDLALTPATYVLARGPGWPLHLLAWLDRLWCATPLAPWSSGFALVARSAG